MSLSADNIQSLSRSGRFTEIYSLYKTGALDSKGISQDQRVELAHALYQAGDTKRALEIVHTENTSKAPAAVRSRCEVILGLIKRSQAEIDEAARHFQSAVHFAKDSKETKQIAWASLHLFRTFAETQPSETLIGMLRDARSWVTRAADSHVSAYMHDVIALMEASAGRFEEARRHLRISLSLIDREPHAGLRQLSLISAFFLDFRECRYADAISQLRAARDLVPTAGAAQKAVIDCNEAHALMMAGRFEGAARLLKDVVETAPSLFALGALDGLARIHLATGHLDECDTALASFERLAAPHAAVATAFAGRWTPTVRVRLLLRKHLWEQAVEEADFHLKSAQRFRDRFLVAYLGCLKAEALAGAGQLSLGAKAIAAADEASSIRDRQGGYYRAAGVLLRESGSTLSRTMFSRAQAIWDEQGNRSAPLEIGPQPQIVSSPSEIEDESSVLANSLASAFNVAYSARLLARELLRAVAALECSPEATLHESRHRSPDLDFGDDDVRALHLGEHRGKVLTLACRIPDDATKAILLADVLRIGQAALALERYREEERNRAALWPASPVEDQAGALFIAEEMQAHLATARRIANTNVPVLITGETGTGKEVLARLIHAYSARAKAPFLPFNCTSTPKDMLDSQLFGHRRGAFTGATEHFQGVIRGAAGGTLFLDEIGDMGLDVQPKLLRFLESNEIHPIGEARPVPVDVRVIAATNAELDPLVSQGRFREDLLYRLNIVQLHLPPLRERRVEIPALAHHYLEKYAREYGKGDLRLSEETMEYLVLYRWPGNVRQLANEMRRLAALAETGAVLMPEHLSTDIAASRRTIPPSERTLDPTEVVVRLDQPMAAAVQHLERTMVLYALKKCSDHMEETAAMLGLSRKGLYLKRQRFGIESPSEPVPAAEIA